MPNPNYLKGVRKERKFVNEARLNGSISFRSAGSHSPIDVVIIDKDTRVIRLIQCKPDTMSNNKREALRQEHNQLNGTFYVKFEVL